MVINVVSLVKQNTKMDKIKHIGVSLLLTIWLLALDRLYIQVVIVVLSLGLAKEYIDWRFGSGKWSWGDIVADCVGILIGVLTYIIIV